MGLFSFKKQTNQSDLSPPAMPPLAGNYSDSDFMPKPSQDMDMSQIPLPPTGMLPNIGTEEPAPQIPPMPQQSMNSPLPAFNNPQEKTLPAFDFAPQGQPVTPQPLFPMVQEPAFLPKPDFTLEKPQGLPALPAVEIKKPSQDWTKEAAKEDEYELPDFDDDELKQIQKSIPTEERKIIPPAPKIDFTIEEPAKFTPKPQTILAPEKAAEPEKKTFVSQETFLELTSFFSIRDELTAARTIARGLEEEMFAQNYKEKLDNYAQLAACLGSIQDRLMLVESKVFENRREEF